MIVAKDHSGYGLEKPPCVCAYVRREPEGGHWEISKKTLAMAQTTHDGGLGWLGHTGSTFESKADVICEELEVGDS